MTPATPLQVVLIIAALVGLIAFLVWLDRPSRVRRQIHAEMERTRGARRFWGGGWR